MRRTRASPSGQIPSGRDEMTILPAQSDLQMRTEYEAMGAHLNRNSTRSQTELDRSWRTGRPPKKRRVGFTLVTTYDPRATTFDVATSATSVLCDQSRHVPAIDVDISMLALSRNTCPRNIVCNICTTKHVSGRRARAWCSNLMNTFSCLILRPHTKHEIDDSDCRVLAIHTDRPNRNICLWATFLLSLALTLYGRDIEPRP